MIIFRYYFYMCPLILYAQIDLPDHKPIPSLSLEKLIARSTRGYLNIVLWILAS